jgi:UDP-glucose 4-epimerase
MSTFLVTGGAGFIGSEVARKLIDQGNSVVVVDNLSTGSISNIPAGCIFLEYNCQDTELYKRLLDFKFDAIFHIAGQSSGEISFDDPVYDLQTNGQSTLQLLNYCRQTGCNKFIYASTMSVYGQVAEQLLPVVEACIPAPQSFYGVGKLASEHYLRIYTMFGITTSALRLFNVYGPGQNLTNMRQGMVSIFLAQALRDGKVHVKGSPERFRDFVYIDDVVDAFLKCSSFDDAGYRCFNISTGVKTKVGELVEQIVGNINKEINVRFEGSTLGDQFGITGDSSSFSAATGWQANMPLNIGLSKMVEWALNRNK